MPPHATADAAKPTPPRDAVAAAPSGTPQQQQQPYRVGSYVIREEIGRGSFATVYRGEKTVRSMLRAIELANRESLLIDPLPTPHASIAAATRPQIHLRQSQ